MPNFNLNDPLLMEGLAKLGKSVGTIGPMLSPNAPSTAAQTVDPEANNYRAAETQATASQPTPDELGGVMGAFKSLIMGKPDPNAPPPEEPGRFGKFMGDIGSALGSGLKENFAQAELGPGVNILSKVLFGDKGDIYKQRDRSADALNLALAEKNPTMIDAVTKAQGASKGTSPKEMLELKKLFREDRGAVGNAPAGSQDNKDAKAAGQAYRGLKQYIKTLNDAIEKGDIVRIQQALKNTDMLNALKEGINRAPAGTPLADNASTLIPFLKTDFDTIDTARLPGLLAAVADMADVFEAQKNGFKEMLEITDEDEVKRVFGDIIDVAGVQNLRNFGTGAKAPDPQKIQSDIAKFEADASKINSEQSLKNLEATKDILKMGASLVPGIGKGASERIENVYQEAKDRLKGKNTKKPKVERLF